MTSQLTSRRSSAPTLNRPVRGWEYCATSTDNAVRAAGFSSARIRYTGDCRPEFMIYTLEGRAMHYAAGMFASEEAFAAHFA